VWETFDALPSDEDMTLPDNTARLLGNSSFAYLEEVTYSDPEAFANPLLVLAYTPAIDHSTFYLEDKIALEPTESFMLANIPTPIGVSVKSVSRDGKITYSGNPNDGTTTGTHTPTVGGGNDMFITGIAGGINIAVAAPQMVCVVNATGHIIYSGYVADNVDVLLPMNGIYVVKGENEAQKIFF
jgi:hypothetical protein